MNTYIKLTALLALVSCGVQESATIYNGEDGKDGANGHSLVSEYLESCECDNGGTRLDIFVDVDDSFSVTEGDLYQNSLIACNGEQGTQGIQGEQGEQGERGPRGLRGRVGRQGLRGQQGEQGEQGEQGIAGTIGAQGAQGEVGPVGPVGSKGPQGEQGLRGLQGIIGDNGTNATASIFVTSSSCTLIPGTSYYSENDRIYNDEVDNKGKRCKGNTVADLNGGDSFWVGSNKLAVDFTSSSMKIITFN